jgi:hypothetical protein
MAWSPFFFLGTLSVYLKLNSSGIWVSNEATAATGADTAEPDAARCRALVTVQQQQQKSVARDRD